MLGAPLAKRSRLRKKTTVSAAVLASAAPSAVPGRAGLLFLGFVAGNLEDENPEAKRMVYNITLPHTHARQDNSGNALVPPRPIHGNSF